MAIPTPPPVATPPAPPPPPTRGGPIHPSIAPFTPFGPGISPEESVSADSGGSVIGDFIESDEEINAAFTAWAITKGMEPDPHGPAGAAFIADTQGYNDDALGSGTAGRIQFQSEAARDFAQASQATAAAALLMEQAISERIGRELTRAEIEKIHEEILSEILGRELTKVEIEQTKANVGLIRSQTALTGEKSQSERFNRQLSLAQTQIGAYQDADRLQFDKNSAGIAALLQAAPSLIAPGVTTIPGAERGGALDQLALMTTGRPAPDSARSYVPTTLPIGQLTGGGLTQQQIDALIAGAGGQV